MKVNLLFQFLALTQILSAQTYIQAPQLLPFEGVRYSSIAFSDVDGDKDQDVLITGSNGSARIAKLYINDGQGSFTEDAGAPFEGVEYSSIAFSDVDGDNDQDVLITGWNGSARTTKLYINDGQGNFTEATGTPFEGVEFGSIAFSDVDGDNDQDVLITGQKSSYIEISKLYINDGKGNFTEAIGTPFEGVEWSSIAFSDVDGDNDQDVLITGRDSTGIRIAKLYTNDGKGNFTEVTGTPFEGVFRGSIAFSDVDGDNDQDVLITGQDNSNTQQISKLYTNDGQGGFTEATGTPFEGVYIGAVAFSDVDGDNDQDVLITGWTGSDLISKLYINDGHGVFTEATSTPFEGVYTGSVAFSDVDGDNDQDLFITGGISSNTQISKLYINDGGISSIINLEFGTTFDFTLFPNPASSNTVSIMFESKEFASATICMYDLNGHLMSQQHRQTEVGNNTFLIDIHSLEKGRYILELNDGKRIEGRMVVIQRN